MTEAIKGLAQIKRAMKNFTVREVHSINMSAARAGARQIERQAKRNLPSRHKKKLGIKLSKRRTRRGERVSFNIGPKRGHAGLRFLEYGVEPHEISRKDSQALRVPVLGEGGGEGSIGTYDVVFTKKPIQHSGIEPTFFLSRGLRDSKKRALDAMGKQYWKRIKAVKAKRRG